MTIPTGPVFSRTPSVGGIVSGLSEMALGMAFLITWARPATFGNAMVAFALELMLLEFILIHSAGFMGLKVREAGSSWQQVKWFVGIGAFYSVFVLGFCLGLDTWRPMISFWVITVQRLAGDLLDPKPSDETRAWFGTTLAVNVMLYLGFVFLTIFIPFPRMGITSSVTSGLTLGNSGGLWTDEPHRVVILAGLYYLVRGFFTADAIPRKSWQNTAARQR